uniref:Uncharacterized protein n=1 Tax=Fagus sylvatica TaxID=28930 RepID=A0A2N9IE99_FAGSY
MAGKKPMKGIDETPSVDLGFVVVVGGGGGVVVVDGGDGYDER